MQVDLQRHERSAGTPAKRTLMPFSRAAEGQERPWPRRFVPG
jgi:hypothetical protein